jgi:hypothetical protein
VNIKSRNIASIALSVALTLFGCSANEAPLAPIEVSEAVVDFGVIEPAVTHSRIVRLINRTHEDVRIEAIKVNCGCINAFMPEQKSLIPAFATGELHLQLTLAEVNAPVERLLFVYLFASGFKDPVAEVRVLATGTSGTDTSPMIVDFGAIERQDLPSSLSITTHLPGNVKLFHPTRNLAQGVFVKTSLVKSKVKTIVTVEPDVISGSLF